MKKESNYISSNIIFGNIGCSSGNGTDCVL